MKKQRKNLTLEYNLIKDIPQGELSKEIEFLLKQRKDRRDIKLLIAKRSKTCCCNKSIKSFDEKQLGAFYISAFIMQHKHKDITKKEEFHIICKGCYNSSVHNILFLKEDSAVLKARTLEQIEKDELDEYKREPKFSDRPTKKSNKALFDNEVSLFDITLKHYIFDKIMNHYNIITINNHCESSFMLFNE